MTHQQFIEAIAPLHQKYAKKYGFKIASAGIAQACLESGYGTSYKAQFHNYHGLKYRKDRVNCNNGYFEDGGSEQNPNTTYSPLPSNTTWYRFDNMEKAVEGYYQFINIPKYIKVKNTTTPLEYLQEIKNAGYATSINYVQNVYNLLTREHLEKYDAEIPTTSSSSNKNQAINIVPVTSIVNTTSAPNRKIDFIVLHYTAGVKSTKGSAQNTARYFGKTSTKASADFIVDDGEIVQYNPDPKNRYCWSVGGKKYSSMSTFLGGKYYGQCTNKNSISIEMCSRKTNTSTLKVTDDDWYLTEEVINNAAKLTKYLMKTYNIDINHVIMHHMVTGKWCPQPWTKNESALIGWNDFLKRVGGASVSVQPKKEPTAAYLVKINTSALNVRKGPSTSYPIVGTIRDGGVYTIVEEKSGWGKLKSGLGWISLKYTIKK